MIANYIHTHTYVNIYIYTCMLHNIVIVDSVGIPIDQPLDALKELECILIAPEEVSVQEEVSGQEESWGYPGTCSVACLAVSVVGS